MDDSGSIEGLQEKLRRVFDAVYQGGFNGGLTAKAFSAALTGIAESYFRPDMTDDDKAEVVRAIHAVAKGLNRNLLGEHASQDETIREKNSRLRAYYDRQLRAAASRGESGVIVAHWDLSDPVLDYSYRRVGHLLDSWGNEALKGTDKQLVADPSDERLMGLLVDSRR